MKLHKLFVMFGLALAIIPTSAQRTFDLKLYDGRPTYVSSDANDTAKVRVYLPEEKMATGRAVVICPGGGYVGLAIGHEGYDWGEFFQSQGIAAVVLKYRFPRGNPNVPISDAENALKLVRRHAEAWKINSNDVGIMGSSAGGHLAATIATTAPDGAKPNFQILFYPVISMMEGYGHAGSLHHLLGNLPSESDQRKYSADMNVSHTTPRAFIVLSDDDDVVPSANGVNYYLALNKNGVRSSLHVFPSGGHGCGCKVRFRYHAEMMMALKAWLRSF